MTIVLIGYRGSGKSTVGRKLAATLGMDFVDTDELLVRNAGKTIKEIFEAEGEQGFRDRESRAIAEACRLQNTVIAAGGGAILRPDNVAALRAVGRVIWLQAPAEILHARIIGDRESSKNRPNLTAAGGLEEVRKLLALRLPLYTAAAHHAVDISHFSVEQVVERILAILRTPAQIP